MSSEFHTPVLSHEAVDLLINPRLSKNIFVDGTLGSGGYTSLLCGKTTAEDRIIAIDKDLNAIAYAGRALEFCRDRLLIIEGNFGDLGQILGSRGIDNISGIVLDLGLSSYQLEAEEGFSYLQDTRLDMRASKRSPLTAEDVINDYGAEELERVFEEYGEIGNSRRLVKAITAEKRISRIVTTQRLADLISREYRIGRKNRMDFLSKIFQALRIEVNNEIENLHSVLSYSFDLCRDGGRIVIVSYHSIEDRIVKNFFRDNSEKKNRGKAGKSLRLLTKKPVVPAYEEVKANRRSRSAKLRAAEIIQTT